jgi:hypothetical protein
VAAWCRWAEGPCDGTAFGCAGVVLKLWVTLVLGQAGLLLLIQLNVLIIITSVLPPNS